MCYWVKCSCLRETLGTRLWCGMVWYMVWYHDMVSMVPVHGMVYGKVWCMVRYGMLWYGMVWCGMVWYGIVYGKVWYAMVWCMVYGVW